MSGTSTAPDQPVAVTAPAVTGLTAAAAQERLHRDGPNELPPPPRPHPLRRLARQLVHRFALLLWAASGLAVLAGMPPLAVAIALVVLVNGTFAFVQEHKADRAAEQLQRLVPARARVRRDGVPLTVAASDVVEGDLLLLEAGERVCADLALRVGSNLAVDGSLLTGESVPERPEDGARVLCGTYVVQGEGEGEVVATGARTRLAGISALTSRASVVPSPLTRQLDRVVSVVSVVAVVTGTVLVLAAVLLGMPLAMAFLFGLGVMVALVPEGLLPTVTLSLALGAQQMARRHELVRHLDAVESLGATTVVCTDKTGTLTRNQMSVVAAWTPVTGLLRVPASGYEPSPGIDAGPAGPRTAHLATAALTCVRGRLVADPDGVWRPHGDPMEVALDVFALRQGLASSPPDRVLRRFAYTADRRMSSAVDLGREGGPELFVLGAPEAVLARVADRTTAAAGARELDALAEEGLRVLAVAGRALPWDWDRRTEGDLERDLVLVGLVALEDPPRPDVGDAVRRCRDAGIALTMVTGDHPRTAAAIAREVGLLRDGGRVLVGADLPADDGTLAALVVHPLGVVVARVSPEDKLRIATSLQVAGHVVAMTGDGVNDAPALRAADVGIAMGASGSDVARAACDLVLLDDDFATIVTAIELGRATTANIRRFLTYHLTDNVAELAPFAAWALTGGSFPLAIGVLQVLALDIGTDMLPALALGTEPAHARTMTGPAHRGGLVDRRLLGRAFGVLGPAEAAGSLGTFALVLVAGGWSWGEVPGAGLLAAASGSAFAAIAVGQLANAIACRSATVPAWRTLLRGNRALRWALLAELVVCAALLGVPAVADLLGGSWPPPVGWLGALATAALVVLVDAAHKTRPRRARPTTESEPS